MMVQAGLDVTEKQFQRQILDLAHLMGWRTYHTWSSVHSAPGFPDLVLVRGPRCIFVEVKRAGANPTPAQTEWLEALRQTGNEVYIWRPDDWPDIERTLRR